MASVVCLAGAHGLSEDLKTTLRSNRPTPCAFCGETVVATKVPGTDECVAYVCKGLTLAPYGLRACVDCGRAHERVVEAVSYRTVSVVLGLPDDL